VNRAVLPELSGRVGFDGAAVALRDARRVLRYGELIDAVATVADWLRASGCNVVALRADNSIDWVLVDLACGVAGVTCLPLPGFFSTAQTDHCLRAAGADLLLTGTGAALAVVGQVPVPGTSDMRALRLWPDAPAALPPGTSKITFTSGSTGEPKGVCLDAELQWRVARSLAAAIDASARKHLCILPLSTLLENLAGVYAPLLRGDEVVLPDAAARGLSGSSALDLPALLGCIDAERPHSLILVPQLLGALVAACEKGWRPPASLRFVAVGGARVAAELLIQARRWGLPVYEGYGLSECGSVVALNTPEQERLGSVGQVLPHCSVAIEDGEIVVAGACHLGYVGEPDSWHPRSVHTGDLGTVDGAGFLRVAGRRKNLLITSFGRNVNPEWIESELCAQPLFTQCAVVGDGRPFLVALLGTAPGVHDATVRQWIDAVNRRLPDYARVRAWLRLGGDAWAPLLTANGRPRRADIERLLAGAIDALYAHAPADITAS
jgi:long-subunit acyl-CoA synthetase (AMP-forming)